MGIKQSLEQRQNLALSPLVYQSLLCLQKPVYELQEYVQELVLSNPVLEVEPAAPEDMSEYRRETEREDAYAWSTATSLYDEPLHPLALYTQEKTFTDHLYDQLGEMRLVDDMLRSLCEYIIGCLDHRGYLDCPLADLAREMGCDELLLEQALYTVQMLEPTGVGARDLTECLILQLVQGPSFNSLTVRVVKEGLDLLAAKDYAALSKKFHAKVPDVRRAADAIRALNPIPSQGFFLGETAQYSVPEAKIRREGTGFYVALESRLLPQISVSREYSTMLGAAEDDDVKKYLKVKMAEANALIDAIHHRSQTLTAIIETLLLCQQDYFNGGEIVPYTMQQMADQLGLNTSTISRAVQDKTIEFRGKILPLRMFFTKPIRTGGSMMSADKVKRQLVGFLRAEDPAMPLSDDALCKALEGVGISISRRTVAKYRGELGYDIASRRKKR